MWSDGAPGTGGAAGGGAGARALPAGQAGSFWPRRTRRSPCRSARWQVTASPRRAGPPWARGEPGKQPRWHEVHGRGHETVPHADEARFHRELLMQALRNYPAILSGNSLTAVVQTIKGLRKRKQITSHTQGLRVACGRDGGATGPAGSGAAGERTPCPAGATARPSAPAGRPPARGREGRAQLRRCRTADHLLASRGAKHRGRLRRKGQGEADIGRADLPCHPGPHARWPSALQGVPQADPRLAQGGAALSPSPGGRNQTPPSGRPRLDTGRYPETQALGRQREEEYRGAPWPPSQRDAGCLPTHRDPVPHAARPCPARAAGGLQRRVPVAIHAPGARAVLRATGGVASQGCCVAAVCEPVLGAGQLCPLPRHARTRRKRV